MPFTAPILLGSIVAPRRPATISNTNYTPTTYSPGKFSLAWEYSGAVSFSSQYSTITTSPSFTFANNTPWTVEFWYNNVDAQENVNVFQLGNLLLQNQTGDVDTRWILSPSTVITQMAFNDNTWVHMAITCDGTNWKTWFNGSGDTNQTGSLGNPTSIRIGRQIISNANNNSRDRFDELRISNIVRYTNNFTPPSAAFTSDSNTLALFHFDDTTNADDIG